MNSVEELFGPVIYRYTRAQAIADGVLIDVSETAREAGFSVPVAMTAAVWDDCVDWDDEDSERQTHQDLSGRLWDVVFVAAFGARMHPSRSEFLFQVARVPRDGKSTVARQVDLKLHIGPGDTGEPVITIMQPHED